MSHRVCPWWLGYFLASPVRRWLQDPGKILESYVHEGTMVLEPGPGMGFFTEEMARRIGATGRVVAVDLQPMMIAGLKRRLERKCLLDRVDARVASADSLRIGDLAGKVDFTLVFAVLHELPAMDAFLAEIAAASKPGAGMLLVEPAGHVKSTSFDIELHAAAGHGFTVVDKPRIRRSHAAYLEMSKGEPVG
jgi:ubiquinone/menaquinone biosynthesis C-methylase UbiE